MSDYGERPAGENERCDPPPNNYGIQLPERSLPPQQQQWSGGLKKIGGIMSRENCKETPVEIRVPKWTDCKLWIDSEDFVAAQYNADAALYLTGRLPVHFPDVKFDYRPLRLSTGEELTTREKCSAYVAKIAKGSALRALRRDFKERAQRLILEMVKEPEVVLFLYAMRASPRQAWQPRPQANPEDNDSFYARFFANWLQPKGRLWKADNPSEEAIQASASMATVNPSQYGSLVPVSEDTHSVIVMVEKKNGTPMEVDSVREEAIQALAPTDEMEIGESIELWSPLPPFVPHSPLLATTLPGSETLPWVWMPTKLCDHLSGPFCVRTDLEAFRHSRDGLMPCERITVP